MPASSSPYSTAIENHYCSVPDGCTDADVLFIGSGIGLAVAIHLLEQTGSTSDPAPRVAVADAGPMDLLTHMAHTTFPRVNLIRAGTERINYCVTLGRNPHMRSLGRSNWGSPGSTL